MSASRILVRIVIVLVFLLVGASIGVSRQALRITSKPQEFRSLAKLVAGGSLSDGGRNWKEQQQDFYGTIIETVESAEMSRRALDRVRALNPELEGKECDVAIRAIQTKGSGIINILATGPEPKYTRIFLNALLDEFIGFRQSIREQAQGKVLQRFLQEVVFKQKAMEDSMEKLKAARAQGVDTLSVRSDLERQVVRLNAQRNQRDDLRFKLRTMKDDEADRGPMQALLETTESEIRDIERYLDVKDAALAELKTAQLKFETDKLAYEKLFEQVEKLQSVFNASADYVAIQQRATPPSEHVEDWVMPITLGAVVGGLPFGIVGLLLSLLLVRAPKPPQPPTPIV